MRGVTGRLISGFIGFAVIAATASAQTQPQGLRDRDPDVAASKGIAAEVQEADIHLGSFYIRSQFLISNSAFAGAITLPSSTGISDFAMAAEAPQRLYYIPTRKTVLTADFVPGYTFFDNNGKSGQFNWSARADAHFLWNYLYLDLYATRADQLRAHVADVNSLATVQEDEYGVAGELKYSSRTSAIFSYRKRTDFYPEDRYQPSDYEMGLLDHDEDNVRLVLQHRTFPLTSLFVAGEASNYAFDQVAGKASSRRYAGVGFIHDRGRSTVRVEAGPTELSFDDGSQDGFTGITGKASWSRTNGPWNYDASATRDIGFATFAENYFYESWAANAGIGYQMTRRLTLHGNAIYEKDEFPNPVFGELYRSDTAYLISTGFQYMYRKLGFGADVGYFNRESTYGGTEDSGIRWGLRLSWSL